jgi:hypothetical protein
MGSSHIRDGLVVEGREGKGREGKVVGYAPKARSAVKVAA